MGMRAKSADSAARRRAAIRARNSGTVTVRSLMSNDHAPSKASIKRKRALSPGAVARDSQGKRSAWTSSPYYSTAATIDSRWSRTVSEG